MLDKQQMAVYVTRRRGKIKQILLEALGGKCCICGYDRYSGALEFHHLDPHEKEFRFGQIVSKSMEIIIRESRKCTIICSCCHKEVHAGITQLPKNPPTLSKDFTIPKRLRAVSLEMINVGR